MLLLLGLLRSVWIVLNFHRQSELHLHVVMLLVLNIEATFSFHSCARPLNNLNSLCRTRYCVCNQNRSQ